MNYYEILGIPSSATTQEIKKAYRKKAIELHPDTLARDAAPALKQLAEDRFKELNQIYQILSEPTHRQQYDAELKTDRKQLLIQEIGQLCDRENYRAAIAVAESLYQTFPDDPECCDIYAEVLHALAVQLSEQPQRDLAQIQTYLERAIAVVQGAALRAQIKADLALLLEKDPPTPDQTDATDIITTARAVRLLKAGEAGIRAWNQFRQWETYVPSLAGVDLSEADLSHTNLQGVDLSKANLSQTQLIGTNFDGANLSGATLTGAIADQGSFVGATLTACDWADGSFKGADFTEANLDKAILQRTNGHQAIFIAASLQNVQWSGGNLEETDCQSANFSGAILTQTKARKGNFSEATLTSAHWENANLTDANFSGANLERVDLPNANLQGATFTRAKLLSSNLNGSTGYTGKTYGYHQSNGLDFSGADLSCATLVGVNLSKSNFSESKLQNTKFDQSDLGGSSFANALISNTSFLSCNLRDADLSGARFYFSYLDHQTNITGAKGI